MNPPKFNNYNFIFIICVDLGAGVPTLLMMLCSLMLTWQLVATGDVM